jgi:hypothetical protein
VLHDLRRRGDVSDTEKICPFLLGAALIVQNSVIPKGTGTDRDTVARCRQEQCGVWRAIAESEEGGACAFLILAEEVGDLRAVHEEAKNLIP